MRIEIDAGGLGAGIAVAEYQVNMVDFLANCEAVINSFKAVNNRVYELSGGVGSLQTAADEIEARIQEEKDRKVAAARVWMKSNDLLELAIRVDKQVAEAVNQNREEFYQTNPWLRPAPSPAERPWYENVWNWLCGVGGKVADAAESAWNWISDTAGKAWNWISDTAKKAWNGLVTFYNEHKKVIDTVLIVAGAIAAIAAVVVTGGAALAPLLGALGVAGSTAAAISTAVAVVAVVSTVGSSVLNIIDVWEEIDDPTFNTWQKSLNIVSFVSNGLYSIGNTYNSIKGINPKDYVANNRLSSSQSASTMMFDDSVPIQQDTISSSRHFVKGDHYDDFVECWESDFKDYTYTPTSNPQVEYVRARDIEGVELWQGEIDNPSAFWNKRYSKADYVDYIKSGAAVNNPVEITKVNDSFYCYIDGGRHRIIAAQEHDLELPVIIKGFYTK